MARKGLPGKYIRMAAKAGAKGKTLFKKAWSMYRSAKSKGKKKSNPATYNKGASKVATKTKTIVKYRYRNKPKKHNPGNPRRQRVVWMRNKVINAGVNGLVIGGSTLASTALVNMLPLVSQWAAWQKALAQFSTGVLGYVFIPNIWMKKFFTGTIAGAGITWLLPWMREQFPEARFFGNQLTPYQVSRLQMGQRGFSARELLPTNAVAGPWNAMDGPWNAMEGPWNAMDGPLKARMNQGFKTVANS